MAAHDHHLLYSMCIHSLHTRRVVQFLLESVDALLVADVLVARCLEISMTQQGCIIMQRAMDVTPEPQPLIDEEYVLQRCQSNG